MTIVQEPKIKIAIDRGGTFTDCVAIPENAPSFLVKLLSVDPGNYKDAPTEGIRRIMERFTDKKIGRDELIDTSRISHILMGTTVATNALLERKGERCALLVTKGFKDLLLIGDQTRPDLFDLHIKRPGVLYEKVVEVDERVTIESRVDISEDAEVSPEGDACVIGLSGNRVRVLQPLDVESVTRQLEALYSDGFRSIAVCLLHSFTFQKHELQVEEAAKRIGFKQVSVSSQLQPMIKIVPRGTSATADAYLTPGIQTYIQSFSKGFKGGFTDPQGTLVAFMQSDGSLAGINSFSGLKAILSGPAGGVVGYAKTCYDAEEGSPVIGFDMGGTSTDVSRYGGSLEHVFETRTAGITIQSPQLDINTVAAGGGSILFWRNGMFVVGPESASAHPGPACYRKGGPLTVTDANLFLGRLHAESFPKIFGPKEDEALDYEAAKNLFVELTEKINGEVEVPLTPEEVAAGFLRVANENMARPIRALTEARGFRTASHNLSCFGGAGGQHACAIATSLGIHSVLVHKYSSVLSAYGIALAELGTDLTEPSVEVFSANTLKRIEGRRDELKRTAKKNLLKQGVREKDIEYTSFLNLRYEGTDTSLMIREPEDGDYEAAFTQRHLREFSFASKDKRLIVDDIRVTGTGKGEQTTTQSWYKEYKALRLGRLAPRTTAKTTQIYFEESSSFVESPLYTLQDLRPGTVIHGPAIILDATQTIVVFPSNEATVLSEHVFIDVGLGPKKALDTGVVDPIALSIFGNRFMAIAEQMGRVLQKCAISLQIKERLDFSCAIFSADCDLVANAPHVPVHLGSMQYAVKGQAELHKGQLRPGDVLVSNHPKMGGTHLPDITVICPVFHEEGGKNEIVFYVAARAHHNDIGGLKGNSMPPESEEIWQEGALIYSAFLVRDGVFKTEEITKYLTDPGTYANCKPSARIDINISDLKAQVAACAVGSDQIKLLFEEFGREVTLFYMFAIRQNAEMTTRSFFKTLAKERGTHLQAVDYMDDGSPIALTVTVDAETGGATFDFEGTGESIEGNINVPKAVANAAITYCIRCMIGTNMPLNAGVLAPLEIKIPTDSLLDAAEGVAVSSGNTETSQRITDVIFKAFEATAASQGCMNMLQFVPHDSRYTGYGETVCGGSGAGPTWAGTSGVHINMTNTRMTDTEILEKTQPVILRQFTLRPSSGGIGRNRGGDGVIREFEFSEPMNVAINGERRVNQPYGMKGGGPGERGAFFLCRKKSDEEGGGYRRVKTKPSATVVVRRGDRVVLHTPGGGGWGEPSDVVEPESATDILKLHGFTPRANGSWAEYQSRLNSSN